MAGSRSNMVLKSAFGVIMRKTPSRARSISPYDSEDSVPGIGSVYSQWDALDKMVEFADIDQHIGYDEFFERFWWQVGHVHGMAEEDFKEYWRYELCEVFRPCFEYQSSYLRGYRSEARKGAQLNYDKLKPKDLKRFVNERGLGDPFAEGLTLKYFYLRLLVPADREQTLRFMDLPPEMRLCIYKELLIFPDTGRQRCDTAILRASREINKEANEILYECNIITCKFGYKKDVYGKDRDLRSAQVHNDLITSGCNHGRYGRIPEGIDDYPQFLRYISRLRIVVAGEMYDHRGGSSDCCFYPLNHHLYTLASFLMDGHRLKEVQIEAHLTDLDTSGNDFGYGFIFWPLRRLRNIKEVVVNGIPSTFTKKIIQDLTSSEPVFNTMRQWKLLQDQAWAQLDLLKASHSPPDCGCGDCYMTPHMDDIISLLPLRESEKLECCLNSVLEENFIARLAKLRNVLAWMEVDRLEDLVKVVKAKRVAWEEYKAGIDEGRLDEAAGIWEGKIDDDDAKGADDHDWSDDESIDAEEKGERASTTEDSKEAHLNSLPSDIKTGLKPSSEL